MRAAVYTRVSTEEQAAEAHSLEAQERACRDYAARRGWEVVRVYCDPGASGRSMSRPALMRLTADAAQSPRLFDVVIVHKLDRWSRSIRDTITSLDDLEAHGVSFAAAAQSLDRTTPEGKLMMMLLAVFAETYIDNLRQETAKGKRERALKGLYNGSLPFGYERAPRVAGQPAQPPHPHAMNAVAVGEAFALASGGRTIQEVCDYLNAHGFRTTGNWGSRPFGVGTVGPMLRSRFYLGEVSYKGEWHKGRHEPLVTPEIFEAVQKQLDSRKSFHNGVTVRARAYPLRGLLVCEDCRQSFRGWARRDGVRHYRDTANLKGVSCPHRAMYRADLLEGGVADLLAAARLPDDWLRAAHAMLGEDDNADERLRRREALLGQLNRAKQLYIAGDIDRAEWEGRKRKLASDLAATEPKPRPDLRQAASLLAQFGRLWRVADDAEREALLRSMLRWVVVKSGSIVAIEPLDSFYPLLAQASGVRYASDGGRTKSRHHSRRVAVLPPGTVRKIR